jgi:DUF4097 and DUF4098 domain-containing protein YvlB
VEEERLMILKMLEEGKITSEEAAALFDALDDHAERVVTIIPPQVHVHTDDENSGECCGCDAEDADDEDDECEDDEREDDERDDYDENDRHSENWDRVKVKIEKGSEDAWDEFSRRMEDFGERVGKAAEELSERLSDKFSRLGEELGERAYGFSFGNWLFGANYRFDDTISSDTFGTQEGCLEVELRGVNGNLTISTWDGTGMLAEIRKSLRAGSEEEAIEHSKKMIISEITPQRCCLVARDQHNASASIKLHVPKNRQYKLVIRTTNGNIRINDIEALTGDIVTTNGKILFGDFKGETLRFHSTNGRISGDLSAEGCEATTVNGRIEIELDGTPGGNYQLRTTNGRIELGVPSAWPCMIEARSNWGSIDIDLDNLTYHERTTSSAGGNKRIRASRTGQGNASELRLLTSNGSIKIRKRGVSHE